MSHLLRRVLSIVSLFLLIPCVTSAAQYEKYWAAEAKSLDNSMIAIQKSGIDIIPTPKEFSLGAGEFTVSAPSWVIVAGSSPKSQLAACILNAKLKACGADLPVSTADKVDGRQNVIVIGTTDDNPLAARLVKDWNIKLPSRPQGYTVDVRSKKPGQVTALLCGCDEDGVLYAGVSGGKLLSVKKNTAMLRRARISDWPDIRYREMVSLESFFRNRFWSRADKDAEPAKRFVDWCLEHKINVIRGPSGSDPYSAIGDPSFRTAEQRRWLKEVNDYARDRGIMVILPQTWAVGVSSRDKNKPEFKDCVDHRGGLFTWDRDDLLSKKAQELVEFIRETGYTGVFFHCIDTTNERFDDRGDDCRFRFGNDRAAADANVINSLDAPLRQSFPDIYIAHVVYDYSVNDRVWNAQKNYMSKLGSMIPKQDSISLREGPRDLLAKYRDAYKHPIYLYQENFYGDLPGTGWLYSDAARFFRTYYFGGDDYMMYPVFWPETNAISLTGEEYAWNTAAPGSALYPADLKTDRRYAWLEGMGNGKTARFLARTCADIYGADAADTMVKLFSAGLNKNYALEYDAKSGIYDKQTQCSVRDFLAPSESGSSLMKKQAEHADACARSLEELLQKVKSGSAKIKNDYHDRTQDVVYFLSTVYEIKAGAQLNYHLLKAQELQQAGDISGARQELQAGMDLFPRIESDLKEKSLGLAGLPRLRGSWNLADINGYLQTIRAKYNILKLSLMPAVPSITNTVIKQAQSAPLNVAIYDASADGGLSYGQKGILETFQGAWGINAAMVADISPENLQKYDCLIIPSVKKLKDSSAFLASVRKYVCEQGHGVLLLHDSVGADSFPLAASMFPEVALGVKNHLGYPEGGKPFREQDNILTVALEHPVTEGYSKGESRLPMYFDHFSMKGAGPAGKILAVDYLGDPSIIAGEAGHGRVVFAGIIPVFNRQEKETTATGFDRDMLYNSVFWLAGRSPVLDVTDKSNDRKVLSDGTYSFLRFKVRISPVSAAGNIKVYCKVYNADNDRPLGEYQLFAISSISKDSSVEDRVCEVKVPEVSKYKVVVIMESDERKLERRICF